MRYVILIALYELIQAVLGRIVIAPPYRPEPEPKPEPAPAPVPAPVTVRPYHHRARHVRNAAGGRAGWSLPEMVAYGEGMWIPASAVDLILAAHRDGRCALEFWGDPALPPYGDPPREHQEEE